MTDLDIDVDFLKVKEYNTFDDSNILDNLKYLSKKMKEINHLSDVYFNRKIECSTELIKYEEHLNLIQESKNYYIKGIDLLYENTVKELEEVVNTALKYIFYDTQYQIKIELEDKRGKSLSFYIVDKDKNTVYIDDTGLGVRTVVSFVLHIYYLINKGSLPFIFLDEKLSGISQEYINRFFVFVKAMCEKKNLILVLISHDNRFKDLADKIYTVGNGVVTETKSID